MDAQYSIANTVPWSMEEGQETQLRDLGRWLHEVIQVIYIDLSVSEIIMKF